MFPNSFFPAAFPKLGQNLLHKAESEVFSGLKWYSMGFFIFLSFRLYWCKKDKVNIANAVTDICDYQKLSRPMYFSNTTQNKLYHKVMFVSVFLFIL